MGHIHATCVALPEGAVALRGPAGSGKSDLALRLIAQGALLVGDDYCAYRVENQRVIVSAPPRMAGILEVRGLGPLPVPHQGEASLIAIVDLLPLHQIERLPDDAFEEIMGAPVRRFALSSYEASAPDKARLAARIAVGAVAPVAR